MKTFLILAVILFMAANLFPQRFIIIHKNDGSGDETILASKIDSITFLQPSPPSSFQCGVSQVSYEGKNYNTVQIVNQCWLKENLNVGTMINVSSTPTNNGTIEKYCYNNDPAKCTTYGGLYLWAEAVAYTNGATNTSSPSPAFTGNIQGICPTGWHLPTSAEYRTLATTVSNNSNPLKAVGYGTGSGTGTNTSGFSALLAGYRHYNGFFGDLLEGFTYFWTSTEYNAAFADDVTLYGNDSSIYFNEGNKAFGFSVRCAKD